MAVDDDYYYLFDQYTSLDISHFSIFSDQFSLKKKKKKKESLHRTVTLLIQYLYRHRILFSNSSDSSSKYYWGCLHGVMVKALACRILVSKFELQLRYYVRSRTNTLGKGMNPPYPPSYGLNSITAVLLEGWLWH